MKKEKKENRKLRAFRMNEKEFKLLNELAESEGVSKTTMIIRALVYYKKMLNEGKVK